MKTSALVVSLALALPAGGCASLGSALVGSAVHSVTGSDPPPPQSLPENLIEADSLDARRAGVTAYLVAEVRLSDTSKQCVYRYGNTTRPVTVSHGGLCSPTITLPRPK